MKYDMTTPCDNCPFRKKGGIHLTQGRVVEIATNDGEFPCHKTVDYSEDEDGETTPHSKMCAGFIMFREKTTGPNQMMRISERIGLYDPSKFLKDNPAWNEVFDSLAAMSAANRLAMKRKTATK